MKTLATITIIMALLSSCDKGKGYPKKYVFTRIESTSDIRQFDKTTEFNGVLSKAAKDSKLNNFPHYLEQISTTEEGSYFEFLDDHRVRVGSDVTSSIYKYSDIGKYVLINDDALYHFSDDQLTISYFFAFWYKPNDPNRWHATGLLGSDNLTDLVQKYLSAGDTSAARSYDVVYLRQ